MAIAADQAPAATITAHPLVRRLTLLAAASLTVMSGATIAPSIPALQTHFASVPNADLLARLVLTIPALFVAVFAPLAGLIADRFGRVRLLFGAVLLYAAAGASGLVLDSLTGILVGRALLGAAVAGTMTAAITLVGDYFEGDARDRFMSIQTSFNAFGGVVFLAAGGVLADLHWRGPFAIYLLAIALLPMIAITLYEPDLRRTAPGQASPSVAGAPPYALMAFVYGLGLVSMSAFYVIPSQLPFYLLEFGISEPSQAGLAIACFTLATGVAALLYRHVKARISYQGIFATAFTAQAVAYVLIANASGYGVIVAALFIGGAGAGIALPSFSLWLLAHVPAALRGRAMGGLTMSLFLGQFLSPLLTQPIARAFGLFAVFAFTSALVALFAVGFIVAAFRRARTAEVQPSS